MLAAAQPQEWGSTGLASNNVDCAVAAPGERARFAPGKRDSPRPKRNVALAPSRARAAKSLRSQRSKNLVVLCEGILQSGRPAGTKCLSVADVLAFQEKPSQVGVPAIELSMIAQTRRLLTLTVLVLGTWDLVTFSRGAASRSGSSTSATPASG